jgi:hypothetical protein
VDRVFVADLVPLFLLPVPVLFFEPVSLAVPEPLFELVSSAESVFEGAGVIVLSSLSVVLEPPVAEGALVRVADGDSEPFCIVSTCGMECATNTTHSHYYLVVQPENLIPVTILPMDMPQ